MICTFGSLTFFIWLICTLAPKRTLTFLYQSLSNPFGPNMRSMVNFISHIALCFFVAIYFVLVFIRVSWIVLLSKLQERISHCFFVEGNYFSLFHVTWKATPLYNQHFDVIFYNTLCLPSWAPSHALKLAIICEEFLYMLPVYTLISHKIESTDK